MVRENMNKLGDIAWLFNIRRKWAYKRIDKCIDYFWVKLFLQRARAMIVFHILMDVKRYVMAMKTIWIWLNLYVIIDKQNNKRRRHNNMAKTE